VRRLVVKSRRGAQWALAACLFGWFAGAAVADEPAPLRLCADPDNLPYSSANQQTPGLYIELGQQLAQALGRRFQAVWVPTYYPKRQVRQKLLTGQCDGFLGLPDDPDFMGPRLIFSQPIVRVGYALVAPPAMKLTSVQGLHGHRVAVQWGSPPQSLLATWNDVQTVTAMSPEEAMKDLVDGKAEAAFIWGPSARWQNSSALHNAYRVVPVDGDHMQWDAGIAFARDHTALRDDVNRALDRLAPAIRALSVRYGFVAQTLEQAGAEATATAESAAEPTASAADIAEGRQIFNTTCAHCHGHDAVQGEQRRNLRMLRIRYGDKMAETFLYTVTHGRVSKGMPNWRDVFTDGDFHRILAFLETIQDKPPATATADSSR
jgi:polar amino acid transport system substrate-binding protein